jgi:hypothetical protein
MKSGAKQKFDFDVMKSAATSEDANIRKQGFIDYFDRFEEFPTYLFETQSGIEERLLVTMGDILHDPESSTKMKRGIEMLLERLPMDSRSVDFVRRAQ